MFEFQKLCHDYAKMSYDERLKVLITDSAMILPAINTIGGGIATFVLLVTASCAADGKLTVAEYSLFKDATGLDISYDAAAVVIDAMKGKDLRDVADIVVDAFGDLNEDVKCAMVSFCLCFCTANGRALPSERRFIRQLIK